MQALEADKHYMRLALEEASQVRAWAFLPCQLTSYIVGFKLQTL